jgi:hypothetical protein
VAKNRRGGGERREPRSIREGEQFVAGDAQDGHLGSARAQPDNLIAGPTGAPGMAPAGRPARIDPGDDFSTRRSLEMENAAAVILADRGWRIKQKPTKDEVVEARRLTGDVGNPRKNPDYLIEGHIFDCYAPTNPDKDAWGVWSAVQVKINKGQTQRVVVNLEDWRGDVNSLREQFAEWPMPGLKEVKVITPGGDIIQFDLASTTD